MKILEIESNPFLANNSLLRGEQVFTSLLFYEGKMLFVNEHLERLIKGAEFLFPKENWQKFKLEIYGYVLQKIENMPLKNYYCRLTIIDNVFFMNFREHEYSSQNVSIARGFQVKTPSLRPSFLKLSQYADSFLELRNADEKWGDIVFFDQNNFLTEASTSNIFVVKKTGKVVTPHLSSMVLDGILRAQLCKKLQIVEEDITEIDLLNAQEIWLSNSIRGIRFVNQYETKRMVRKNSLFDSVLENFGRYGEKICE